VIDHYPGTGRRYRATWSPDGVTLDVEMADGWQPFRAPVADCDPDLLVFLSTLIDGATPAQTPADVHHYRGTVYLSDTDLERAVLARLRDRYRAHGHDLAASVLTYLLDTDA
jgi:phosphatidylethanolamine-binding protein (PEBP) family uncharacterized protein